MRRAAGVWENAATLPEGWRERLSKIQNENTRQVTALGLDPQGLAVFKLLAAREKDRDFIGEMHRHDMLDSQIVWECIALLSMGEHQRCILRERWELIVKG